MFRDTRRKKMRNRVIFAALGVLVLAFGLWLNFQNTAKEEQAEDVAKKVEIQETKDKENKQGADQKKNAGTDTETQPETYLVKEVDGVVKVFLCDKEGDRELYLITSIPFDLLSEQDQQLFIDGVELKTEEDLGRFLENFDS